MARAGAFADALLDALSQRVVQPQAVAQHHEQDDAGVAFPLLADGDAVHHFGDGFHLAIDFGSADAHTAGIQRCVRAAMDNHAAVGGYLGEIAMRPDAIELVEIGGAILGLIVIVPEADGCAGKGFRANQLALSAWQRTATFIEYVHRHAQPFALQFAFVHRQPRAAQSETGDEVRAAADGGQRHVCLDIAVDVAKTLVGEWRASGKQSVHGREIVRLAWPCTHLFQGGQILRANAENADPLALGQVEERVGVRMEGRTVVQHDSAARRQAGNQPIPHHPTAGGEEEQVVLALQIHMQHMLFQMLQQRAANAVNDALRFTRRAGRIHDVERMVERSGCVRRGRLRMPTLGGGDSVLFFAKHGNPQQMADGIDGVKHGARPFANIVALAAVAIAVAGNQHLGGDLTEPIQRPFNAEIRRAGRPDRADACRRQHGDHRFRHVRQPARHAIVFAHAEAQQLGAKGHRRRGQFAVGQRFALAVFQHGDDGDGIGVVTFGIAQEVGREIEPCRRKPTAARKSITLFENRPGTQFAPHIAEIPNRPPELLAIGDRPCVQSRVIRRLETQASGKAGEIGVRNPLRAGLPQRLAHAILPKPGIDHLLEATRQHYPRISANRFMRVPRLKRHRANWAT